MYISHGVKRCYFGNTLTARKNRRNTAQSAMLEPHPSAAAEPEVRSFSSVDGNTCLLAGAEQEGPAHNPWSTEGPSPVVDVWMSLVVSLPNRRANPPCLQNKHKISS